MERRARIVLSSLLIISASMFAAGQSNPKPQKKGNYDTQKSTTQPGVAEQSNKSETPTSNNPVKAPGELDQKFLKEAAIGDAAEIALGQMAQEKASDPKVKQFGARMVQDHSKADDQLKHVAQTQHVSLPTELDPPHKAEKARLSQKTGSQFDKAYSRLMVQEHTKTIDKFQREASSSKDPTVKKFAQETLPILKSHLQEAQQLEKQINGGT